MALRDYICCGKCSAKVIYDGDDRIRDALSEPVLEAIRCESCAIKDAAALAARDAALKQAREAMDDAKAGISAAYFQADAEFRGHDVRAEKFEAVVKEARSKLYAAIRAIDEVMG